MLGKGDPPDRADDAILALDPEHRGEDETPASIGYTANLGGTLAVAAAVGILTGGPMARATAATLRHRLFTMPGRLVRSARRLRLRLPADWPREPELATAMTRIAAIPAPT